MGLMDLHVHTNKSDGQHPPEKVVALAAEAGISVLAITDHDTVDGLSEGETFAGQKGIDFIPGIEISVRGDLNLHILGYYIDYADPGLLFLCEEFVRIRIERGKRIVDFLKARGADITEEQVMKHVTHGVVGRMHFSLALVEQGYASSVQDAFDKYLGIPEFAAIERPKPTAEDGISSIIKAGGAPVLAHPGLLKLDDERMDSLIFELKGYGLKGIECHYTTHTKEQTEGFLGLAAKHSLVATCGSDFHGEDAKPGFRLGETGIEADKGYIEETLKGLRNCKGG